MVLLSLPQVRAAVLTDNPTARVLRNDYPPGIRSPMHRHSSGRFVYVIAGGTLRVHTEETNTESDGRPPRVEPHQRDVTLETGAASWRFPEKHALESIGSSTVSVLEVELKEAAEKECRPEDASTLGLPEGPAEIPGLRIVFRNRWGTVVFHRDEPGRPFVCPLPGRDRFFYWLTTSELRASSSQDGTERTVPRSAGAFDWLLAGHEPTGVNVGSGTVEAVEVIVEKSLPQRRMIIKGLDAGAPR